ncbi:hypothetical protein E4T56_gene712 [Termitomyces sp. T112]|nr:hypothetical protein E4T56_gene712 [Termitomyces sp. T112]
MSDQQVTTGIKKIPTSNVGDIADITQVFLGEQLLVSHDGLSQYSRHSSSAGHSACGLAALDCVRLTFEKQNAGVTGEDLIRWLSSRQGTEEITSICEFWTNPSHLDVEDILKVLYFSNSVNLLETYYETCGLASFRMLLQITQKVSTLSAVVITKPPEIVACIKLPTPKGDVFLVFDSHIRPNHPNGAGFIINSSIEATATYLSRLFWVDETSLTAKDDSFGFQMDLIRQFCGYIIGPKPSPDGNLALTQSLLEASIKILTLTAELADSKATILSLKAKSQPDNFRFIESPNGGCNQTKKQRNSLRGPWRTSVASSFGKHSLGKPCVEENPDKMAFGSDSWGKPASDKISSASSFKTRKQIENDYEKQERQPAKGNKISTCMSCSKHLERDMVRISVCNHWLCKNCLREYVSSSLRQDHQDRFPIFCPVCVAYNTSFRNSGSIDEKIIRQISTTEEDYRAFEKSRAKGPFDVIHCTRFL